MDKTSSRYTLLEELDDRQNQVIAELDALNDEIISILKHWSPGDVDGVFPVVDAA